MKPRWGKNEERLKRSQVELISGQTHRDKKFLIRGTQCAELERKVAAAK